MGEQSEANPNIGAAEATKTADPMEKINKATADLVNARKSLAQGTENGGIPYMVDARYPQTQSTPDTNGGSKTNGGVKYEKPVSILQRVKDALAGK